MTFGAGAGVWTGAGDWAGTVCRLIFVLVTVGAGLAELVGKDGELERTDDGGLIVVVLHAASPRTAAAPAAVMTNFIAHLPRETTA